MLTGKILGEKFSRVNGYIKNGIFSGVMYSEKDNLNYHVQQIAGKMTDNKFHSVIYRNIDVNDSRLISSYELHAPHILNNVNSNSFKSTRSSFTATNKICNIFIEVDSSYSDYYGGSSIGAYQAITRIAEASYILQNTVVTASQNLPEGFKIRVKAIRANSSTTKNPSMFTGNMLNVDDVMLKFAQLDFRDYCLAVIFFSKPFNDGVAGAAYNAKLKDGNGGICSGRYYYDIGGISTLLNLNVLMITNQFYDQPMYAFQEIRNILHELGHSFGSGHDSTSLSHCTPSNGDGGAYLMYPTTPNVVLKNTFLFSQCSRASMEIILASKSYKCFAGSENLCGNSIIDSGEECDCGDFDPFCNDKCCNLPSSVNKCKLVSGYVCSPKQGECCDENSCSYKSLHFICMQETLCSSQSYCTGISSVCPKAVNKNDGYACDIFGNICSNGTCSGSPCLAVNSKPCRCLFNNNIDDQCKLCCLDQNTGVCQPSQFFPILKFHFQSPGSPCGSDNSYGICDDQGICIIGMTDETQNNIIKLRNLEIIFRQYWLYVLLIAFGLTFITTGAYLLIRLRHS